MSRWAKTLVTAEAPPRLELLDYVGQRVATFRFDLVNSVTGYRVPVYPLSSQVPVISHNTGRTITRQLNNLIFTVPDSARVDVVTSRVEPFMLVNNREYQLGRYMYNNEVKFTRLAGDISSGTLYDEGFIVDQSMPESFSDQSTLGGTSGGLNVYTAGRVERTLRKLLTPLPVRFSIASSPYHVDTGWPAGTSRGFVVEQLAVDGDYFSPWFDHTNTMRFVRSFDPASVPVTLDLDAGNRVIRDRISRTNDLIEAPNLFVVIANGAEAAVTEIVGTYEVPSSAPHSIQNRGFTIPQVEERQVTSLEQAKAVATNIGQRQTVFERVELYTPPDPRHDSYDVLRWQGSNWLELAWSLPLVEGAAMQHVARKAYTT